jgi:hypothetical protein
MKHEKLEQQIISLAALDEPARALFLRGGAARGEPRRGREGRADFAPWPDFTLIDWPVRDLETSFRRRSGRVDLRRSTGQQAVDSAGSRGQPSAAKL